MPELNQFELNVLVFVTLTYIYFSMVPRKVSGQWTSKPVVNPDAGVTSVFQTAAAAGHRCRVQRRGRRGRDLTWEQEERSAVVAGPVAVLGLQAAVEVHAFQCRIHSRVGGWGGRYKLTLRGE